MDEKEYIRRVGKHSRSHSINLPKEITEKLDIKIGSSITFKILEDIITLHQTNSSIPIDIVTNDAFDLTAKIRNLKKKELQLNEDCVIDQIESRGKINLESREQTLNNIRIVLKELYQEFERLKKNVEKTFGDLGESFSIPTLNELNDVLLLSKQLGGDDVKSDYDITIEFIKEIINRKRKYQELIKKTELLKNNQKIPSSIASEIELGFTEEIDECEHILEKIFGLARSL